MVYYRLRLGHWYGTDLRLIVTRRESVRYAPPNLDIETDLNDESAKEREPARKQSKATNKGTLPLSIVLTRFHNLLLNLARTKGKPNPVPSTDSSDEMEVDRDGERNDTGGKSGT